MSTTTPTDLRPIIADAVQSYELAQAAHLREEAVARAEQQRATAILAAIDEAASAARALLERAGLAHILGAPSSPNGIAAPVRRADQALATAFSAAQTAQVELRTALLRLAYAYAAEERWDDTRRIVQPLLNDQTAPLYPDALDLLCLSHYKPAVAALEIGEWVTARESFESVLKLNATYRDAAKLQGELTERIQRQERETAERLQREQRETAERLQREQIAAVQQLIKAGTFAAALDQLEALLKKTPANREAATLAAQIAETPTPPLPIRLRAGTLAGSVGDPRTPIKIAEWQHELTRRNEQFGQPTGYFCFVQKGAYRIGGWNQNEPTATITLPSFWIARFPITVAQYAPFVAAGYGADAYRWWTAEGWKWKQSQNVTAPGGWGQAEYCGPNQPVIGVTWYEATAFCAWLTIQLSDTLQGYALRLPSEAEWEAAAAYDAQLQRQTYPWGTAEPDQDRAIYGVTRPAPVGCCPAGSAACGALDLVGSVWEWMASSYAAYPAQSNLLPKDFTQAQTDAPLRGGAWNDNGTNVRCGARDRSNPNLRGNDGGFRVVWSPRSY